MRGRSLREARLPLLPAPFAQKGPYQLCPAVVDYGTSSACNEPRKRKGVDSDAKQTTIRPPPFFFKTAYKINF